MLIKFRKNRNAIINMLEICYYSIEEIWIGFKDNSNIYVQIILSYTPIILDHRFNIEISYFTN